VIAGVDPGGEGGIAFLDNAGGLLGVYDLPNVVVEDPKRKRQRTVLDLPGVIALLQMVSALRDGVMVPGPEGLGMVYVERPLIVPDQSIQTAANSFENYGRLCGMLWGRGIPVTPVEPASWKAVMLRGMPKGKGSSMVVAARLYPHADLHGPRGGMRDGRAEALLVARYGLQKYQL